MRNSSWLAITLAVSAIAPVTVTTLTIVQPTWAQVVRNDDVPAIMARARAQLQPIRRQLAQAERSGETQERAAALAEMKRILDEVAPVVESMASDVERQRAVHREFDIWLAEYEAASNAGTAETGDFYLYMSNRWKELSPTVQPAADEKPAAFEVLLKDESVEGFGMPRTYAAVRALDTYLIEVQSHPQYQKNRASPNVASDLAQARKARAEASARLADAAKAVLDEATVRDLDDAGRARVRRMLEHDIPYGLSGSPRLEEVQSRARALLNKAGNDEKPADGYLAELADRVWPIYAGRYVTRSAEPMAAGRGSLVEFREARVLAPDAYVAADADLVLMVEGRPVICIFDPVVKQHVANILSETGLKSLPSEGVTVIGQVRGAGSVDLVRQPGSTPATINPAGGEGEASPTTAPTLQARDGVILDVFALKAGPAAIGVDPTPDQTEATR